MKSREQKLTAQIDRLLDRNISDNLDCEALVRRNAAISQKPETEFRIEHRNNLEKIKAIEDRVQRRSRILKKHGANLSAVQTMELI